MPNFSKRITKMLKQSQTTKSQTVLIWEILEVLITPVISETKVIVDPVTPFLSLKLLNPDWSWNMVSNHLWFHHRCWWHVITWMKDVMEDGLILMSSWHKMDTWSVKNVLHIWVKLKEINAKITRNVNQLLKLINLTS